MKTARFLEGPKLVLEDVPPPEPREGEALVAIRHVGICGSDVHALHGRHPLIGYPIVPGHEISAEVLDVRDAESDLKPGDPVVVEPLLRCGACYACRQGRYNCCENLRVLGVHTDGVMCEQAAISCDLLYRYPSDIDSAVAALTEPLCVAYQGVVRGRVTGQDSVVVIGAGPIGIMAAMLCQDTGAHVCSVDLLPERLKHAEAAGIEHAVCAREEGLQARINDVLGRRPTVVLEAVGNPLTIAQAIEWVCNAGRVVIIGVTGEEMRAPAIHFITKELDLLGSRNSCKRFPPAIAFLERKASLLARLVSHRFPLERVQEAFRTADSRAPDVLKVVVECSAASAGSVT